MRRPELGEMNAFVTVAERRSFAKAAVQLGISRSRLSETIRGLEDRLGVRLLNRTTRSVAPTAAGERLLARLRPLLDDFDTVLDSINAFRDKPAGLLRLTVPPPAANLMLAPLLSRFLAQYPAIDLEISVDQALTDIVAGRFDAGIRPGERVERDMIAVRIGEEMRGVIVAAPDYLARHPRPTTPRDLETHNCIRYRNGWLRRRHARCRRRTAPCRSRTSCRSCRARRAVPTGAECRRQRRRSEWLR
jgi:LysR family transcriptional regulator, regulator of peptidoglycan recycling